MKKVILVLLVCLLSVSLICANAEEERTITVSGSAEVALAADYAELQIGVNIRSDSMQEAQQQNAQAISDVLAALYGMGIQEKDVITSQYNVFSGTDYGISPEGEQIERKYYSVENMLHVKIHDLSMAGKALDAAIAAGANLCYGITFGSTEENAAYHKALIRAYEDAQQKAQTLAAAAGKTLGEVVAIDASQGGYGYGIRNTYDESKEMAAGTAIIGGDINVSAGVTVTWCFE